MKARRILKFILYSFLAVILLLVAAVAAFIYTPDTFLRHVAGEKGSAALDRSFRIDGPIHIGWGWPDTNIHLTGLHLANTKGASDPDMVAIEDLDFHVHVPDLLKFKLNLPGVTIDKPVIILEKHADGSANWDFPALSGANAATSAAIPSQRSSMPILDNLTINQGKLVYRDVAKKLDVTLGIQTATAGGGEKGDFKIDGEGKLQDKTFAIHAQGGSLQMLRESKAAYPLHLHIQMGDTVADINGTFLDPVQMEGVDTKLDLRGDSLSNLFYLTMLPLPPTPAYSISGHLTKQGNLWTFENFKGKVGGSDLEGHLTDDISGKRSFLKGELSSTLLDMKDLAGFTGATPEPRKGDMSSPEQVAKANVEKASSKLIPDVPLDLTRLRASDLDVSLKSDKILAPGLPMDNMNVRFLLKEGVLRIDPLEFGIAAGKIKGSLVLDGAKDVPHVDADLSLTRLSLKSFFAGTQFALQTEGFIGGHFTVSGDGKSLAQVLGDSNGRIGFVMSGGSMSELLVDAAGLDVGNAAVDLLGSDKKADIRCAVMDFPDTGGILNSQIFVIDTTASTIGGHARINLKDETIDAEVSTDPKSPTITVHAPILITGRLKHPSIGIDPKEAAARGVAAGVLSVFLTPLAAVIPFIEMGVGGDSDCSGLVAQARAHMQQSAKPDTGGAAK
jgi:uncharacterized protein involved in outer membrane biogenesis